MYGKVLRAEEKRSVNHLHKAIEEPEIKLSDKAKQKILGALCVISSAAALAITKSDASIAYSLIMIPLGLLLICTKEKVIY